VNPFARECIQGSAQLPFPRSEAQRELIASISVVSVDGILFRLSPVGRGRPRSGRERGPDLRVSPPSPAPLTASARLPLPDGEREEKNARSEPLSRGGINTAAALLFCIAALALAACAGGATPPAEPSFYQDLAKPDAVIDSAAAAAMITGYRSNNGLGPVTVDPELMRFAGDQAHAMAAHDKMDHDAARPFAERIRAAGFGSSVAVENISAGYHTLAEAFSGWRDSPPHRANMLNAKVTRIGIAAVYAPNSKYKVFWALVLAGPSARQASAYRWD